MIGTCPGGYKLHPSNQCICVENGNHAYFFERLKPVINDELCRQACENRAQCQYYEYRNNLNECDIWTSDAAIEYDPFSWWPHRSARCPLPKSNSSRVHVDNLETTHYMYRLFKLVFK